MKVPVACAHCGRVFYVAPCALKHGRGKHCSPACQYASRRSAPKKLVTLVCIGCGCGFSRNPSQLRKSTGAGKYCSRACRDAHRRGSLHPQWIAATTHGPRYYGANWQAAKRAARRRDRICQECGVPGPLAVHHVIPIRLWTTKEQANAPDNLVCLCHPCHRRVEARSVWVPVGGGVLRLDSGGYAHALARERGLL